MKLFWFIPTHGDGRYLGTSYGGRPLDYSYLKQIACAVDNLGFYGALLPTGRSCEDAWITAASLIPETHRMRFLIAIRPGLISPSLAARMTATFDRLSDGRLLINVVTGGDPVELAGDGLFLEHKRRYELTDEFLEIWRALLSGAGEVNYEGKYLQVRGGRISSEESNSPTRRFILAVPRTLASPLRPSTSIITSPGVSLRRRLQRRWKLFGKRWPAGDDPFDSASVFTSSFVNLTTLRGATPRL